MAAAVDDDRPSSSSKISRYRSQRIKRDPESAPTDSIPSTPQSPPHDSPAGEGVTRSKSRYHRKNTLDSQSRPTPDSIPGAYRPVTRQSPQTDVPCPPPVKYNHDTSDRIESVTRLTPPQTDVRRMRSAENGAMANGHANGLDRKRSMHRSAEPMVPKLPTISLVQTSSPPDGQLFPPPRPVSARPPQLAFIDGPPSSDQIKATRSSMYLPKVADDDDEAGCFGFFKRKKGEMSPPPIDDNARPLTSRQPVQPIIAGGAAAPGTDAPVSAVNAGDRRVLIECGKTKTLFPVTPTTTPVDLIKSAETVMSEHINVRSAVLLEYFGTVGVQRPLRRYEHIRDVMNSWDNDRQNSLILVDPDVGCSEIELSIAGVPAIKPDDASWTMSYSQKVGKWEKRIVSVKSDGQITIQKDPNKPQQAENICHLSDFDIYTPTQDKIRKKIKPPKKHCFAIKSQQKTSMFESTENFVHFFSTGDRSISDDFYRAVQSWRSWYLVNVMGEGNKAKAAAARNKTSVEFQRGHRAEESFSSHYQLGSFQPLVDLDKLDKSSSIRPTSMQKEAPGLLERHTSTRRNKETGPPVSIHTRGQLAEDEPLANFARRNSLRGSGEFARESIDVVRRNSTRGNRPRAPTGDCQPQGLSRTRSGRDGSRQRDTSLDLHRTSSRRSNNGGRGGPLIDLTPQYREPPQHSKKGKAHRPENIGPGGLIDAATSPEDPIGAPSSVDWRGPQHQSQASHQTEMRSRGYSNSRGQHRSQNFNSSVSSRSPDAGPGFTGEGLLASSQQGWGGEHRGRGVMDGTHAKGPMIDLRERSQFAGGSLLERVERRQGGPGPQATTLVIDRDYS
ncbi:Hypothetical protein R9X50_00680400 [Acrodontium crateriforme]|uniref:PH domain-containing protein n=1 Tax=Acrodontium crateriforme TaxID=150365 RepID=A0AAQ3R727_9PEZI|nr:Hypothetical protein R9X50_00680400 [Acrodontium crateriforme]